MSSSSSKSSQARLREALTAGGPSSKDKGPPVADGVLSVTPDTAEAIEWRTRKSVVDTIASCSTFLDDDDEGEQAAASRALAAPPSRRRHPHGRGLAHCCLMPQPYMATN